MHRDILSFRWLILQTYPRLTLPVYAFGFSKLRVCLPETCESAWTSRSKQTSEESTLTEPEASSDTSVRS